MMAQSAQAASWRCAHCGNEVPSGYAHKCLEYDRAVTFYEQRPLAPMPPVEVINSISDRTKWTDGPLNAHDRHWVQVGARHGFIAGWQAGFAAASGIETEGHDPEEGHGAEHESPTAEGGDAQGGPA
jgi:hypothetical protein